MSEYEILFMDNVNLRTWLTEKLPKIQFEDLDRIVDQVTRRDRQCVSRLNCNPAYSCPACQLFIVTFHGSMI